MKKIVLMLCIAAVLAGCDKRPDPVADTPARLNVMIHHEVNGQPLALKTMYKNEHGDDFEVYAYKYYLTNISLIKKDGTEFKEAESYRLIDESKAATKNLSIKNIADGEYTRIKFLLGVDSLRNVSGAQEGDLAPDKAMFWTWNTGYIMAVIEGYSPQAGNYPENLGFHIGGFSGANSALRWVTLDLPTTAVVTKNKQTTIYLDGDVAEWFKTPSTISFAEMQTVTSPGKDATMIADNYRDMFHVSKVEMK